MICTQYIYIYILYHRLMCFLCGKPPSKLDKTSYKFRAIKNP